MFPLVQKRLWERRFHTKICMETALPRLPAPLYRLMAVTAVGASTKLLYVETG